MLGIGVNVALDESALPAELRGATASLAGETGRAPRPTAVAAAVLSRLAVWYDALDASPARVVSAWRDRAVAWWGRAGRRCASGASPSPAGSSASTRRAPSSS